MKGDNDRKKTSDRIIEAAFSFYKKPDCLHISLSSIAAAAGISKAAIFRHFAGKGALFAAMRDRFFDEYAAALKKTGSSMHDMLACNIDFMFEHPAYCGYFIANQSLSFNFVQITARELKKGASSA